MAQAKDKDRHADNTPAWATGPTEVPAAGSDPDSRMRELKSQLARAEATGDTSSAEKLRKDIDTVRKEHPAVQAAAKARRDAAQGDPDARTRAPQGRTPTPAAKAPTGGTSTTPAGKEPTAKTTGDGKAGTAAKDQA